MKYTFYKFVDDRKLKMIKHYCEHQPKNEAECLSEDTTITETVFFPNAFMDIKCCGVQFNEGLDNTAWTEAVLFEHGNEIACTEVCDSFEGAWELKDDKDNIYLVWILPKSHCESWISVEDDIPVSSMIVLVNYIDYDGVHQKDTAYWHNHKWFWSSDSSSFSPIKATITHWRYLPNDPILEALNPIN